MGFRTKKKLLENIMSMLTTVITDGKWFVSKEDCFEVLVILVRQL